MRSMFDLSLTPDVGERRETYVRYLTNVHYYAQFSPRVMAIAAARCMGTSDALGSYLLRHSEEELGHDAWAREDLHDLGIDDAQIDSSRAVLSCEAMVGYINYIAAIGNPIGLFGWMYVLEGVGSDVGPQAAEAVCQALHLSDGEGLRFIARHGVTDAQHAHDLGDQIEQHVQRTEDARAVEAVAEVIAELYVRMFREIGGEKATWI
jgi:heme oxygenase